MKVELSEKRECARLKFSYPVELKLFSPNLITRSYMGYIKDISRKGACIQIKDRYRRFDRIERRDSWLEIVISVPRGERVSLNARICWIRKDVPQQDSSVLTGLEFQNINDRHLEQINRLSRIRKKDQTMLTNLFDHYIKQNLK